MRNKFIWFGYPVNRIGVTFKIEKMTENLKKFLRIEVALILTFRTQSARLNGAPMRPCYASLWSLRWSVFQRAHCLVRWIAQSESWANFDLRSLHLKMWSFQGLRLLIISARFWGSFASVRMMIWNSFRMLNCPVFCMPIMYLSSGFTI